MPSDGPDGRGAVPIRKDKGGSCTRAPTASALMSWTVFVRPERVTHEKTVGCRDV